MIFFLKTVMGDLIRNYRMLIRGHGDDSDDSESESQPLRSSAASSRTQSFGAINPDYFQQTIDSEGPETDQDFNKSINSGITVIPPILLQKKLNRRLLFPSAYQSPELEVFDNVVSTNHRFESYGDRDQAVIDELEKHVFGPNFDYSDPERGSTHSSLVTIFAIWNTTVGTSLLSMSWGIEKTGLFPAIFINIIIAAICLHTTYLLLKVNEKHGVPGLNWEVCDLCRALIGRWAEIIAKIFSLVVLIGANIVYWILMSNFFYNSVHFIYGLIWKVDSATTQTNTSVLCPKNETILPTVPLESTKFDQFWDLYSTVPIVLALIMFPMLNWKSPTFFTKFNSLGTFSVLYIIIFVAAKSFSWGINMVNWDLEWNLKSTFCALTGMLSLSYFIHNIIISIMRNNRYQEHNGRDLSIAFGLITFTYLFIGVMFYITFPLPKFCIEDNLLNNFDKFDTLTIIARILLLFQLFTVFPLITYMLRNDIFANINMIFKNYRFGEFSYGRVIILNILILIVCILFACFLPRIGTLIRYTGALSGLVYIFMLPSLLKMASLKKERALSLAQIIFHSTIMCLGILNLISQFLIRDS